MNRKLLMAILAMLLVIGILLPINSVFSQNIPNPSHIYWVTDSRYVVSVDPHWAWTTESCEVIQNVYEGLMAFDGKSTEKFIKSLADDWAGYGVRPNNVIIPSPPDPNAPMGTVETWYFRIRKNVKWHDWNTSGLYLRPSDVEYSIERGMMQDHTGGPMQMLFEPLTGVYCVYDYDANHNDAIEEVEYDILWADVDGAVESNTTHVWFNLPAPYAPLQQILCQTCSMILQQEWAITHGCWGATKDYGDFLAHFDPPAPGPLDDPPVMCGTGPYIVEGADWNPHTGWIRYHKNFDYWHGWAGYHAEYATLKIIEDWSKRKAMFFSTDPDFQADLCEVPRENVAEMHVGEDRNGATYPGFRLQFVPVQSVVALFFNYDINPTSPYVPKIGTTDVPDLFEDRFLRLALTYALNVTQYCEEYWLGDMIQPTTCMPPGTAFYNETFPTRNIDTSKVEYYLANAWGGAIYNQGMTVAITYDIGNSATETIARMIEDVIENQITWTGGQIDIQPTGVPWNTYIQYLYPGKLPAFTLWMFNDVHPDPDYWLKRWMNSAGDFPFSQHITYGLGDITEDWRTDFMYGPPPYTNVLGDYIDAINNTYVDYLIATGAGETFEKREGIYNELMCIYYAEAASYPVFTPINRHYERSWVNGWIGGWNENPICPGVYFYDLWKGALTVYPVDISGEGTIANTTEVYSKILVSHGDMMTGGGTTDYATINYNIHVIRLDTGPPSIVLTYICVFRNDTNTGEWHVIFDDIATLGPNDGAPGGEDEYFAKVVWWEGGTMEEGNWTIYLWVSPTGTVGAEVEDSNRANNRDESPHKVEARELIADVLPDGVVDIFDAILLANAFGYSEGEAGFNEDADLNRDKTVDIFDAIILANAFNDHWP